MSEPAISIRNLSKIFGKQAKKMLPLVHQGMDKETLLTRHDHAIGLQGINLDVEAGEIFVIMGLSGSGKSTLIRHFNRLIEPTEGQIDIKGTDITTLSRKQLEVFRQQHLSMVFQRFALLPHRNVLDNVAYGLEIQRIPKEQRLEKASYWLDRVGLTGYDRQYPNQLSGGQQQRVGLARALCTDADILLMDEAFSALDPLIRAEMQLQLKQLQKQLHKTIIFITHDLDEAITLGDRIAILKDGCLIQQGTPQQILQHPADDYVAAFVQHVRPDALHKAS
ncbi:quaternary amine ABC transporter ATP-binding protein [Oceanospirillum linum]|uniref:quaternary amine ABC transporter ATP-binding protein n=1 Tax=Oceanospirillum linum TaxID=966 RepID=UPI00089E327E|nr:glycine betaine/L-proline transport ATP binding subunit [Oleiphilus messinensis]SMP34530.1 glycine betaine/L-proline transport ATP binding subunit [Oceanospirillum linum]